MSSVICVQFSHLVDINIHLLTLLSILMVKFVMSMFVGNLLTSIQVLLVVL